MDKNFIDTLYLFLWMTPVAIWLAYHIICDIIERKKLRIKKVRDENWELYAIGI